jgi:hypothetical protein
MKRLTYPDGSHYLKCENNKCCGVRNYDPLQAARCRRRMALGEAAARELAYAPRYGSEYAIGWTV